MTDDNDKDNIEQYINNNSGCLTSEIIEHFPDIDPEIVIDILHELHKEQKVTNEIV